VTRWALVLALPPVLVSVVVPEAVLGLWPHGSPEAVSALRIVALSSLGATLVGSVNYLLIMSGHSRNTLGNSIPATLLNLSLSLLFSPRYGATGAAIANGGALLAANGIGLYQVWKILQIHPFHRGLLRPMVAAVPAAAWMVGVGHLGWGPWPTVGMAGAGGGLVFLGGISLLGLNAEDQQLVQRVVGRFRRSR
jgi:O-antigen/teichoic acid export membrane protein